MTEIGKDWPSMEAEGMRIVSLAGEGARSQWFRAEQVRLDRHVALKRLRPDLAEKQAYRNAFFEAGRRGAVIVHPSALPVINIYPNHNAIAVGWCSGASLKGCDGRLDSLRAAVIGEAVMDCLASLHATGRSHGNITPGNIFFDHGGGVWLGDFFQQPIMFDGQQRFLGECRYLAPECLGTGLGDWRSDVYSLGKILHGSLRPEHGRGECARVFHAMRSPNPLERGESPEAVLSMLRRLRHDEEARMGVDPDGKRRQRRYRRVPTEFDVSLRKRSATPEETAVILMKIRDIGESGVFVETDDDLLVVGSIIELDFTLKGVGGNVHAFGVVRWKSAPPLPKGVGVQFMEVDRAGLERLRNFLKSRSGQNPP